MQIELGKISGVWGVKGWVKLHSYTRNRVEIANYSSWWLTPESKLNESPKLSPQAQQFEIETCRAQGQTIVAKLVGINTREQAEELKGYIILVDQEALPALPEGEYYWQQLIGLLVVNAEGIEFGKIQSILETGANDVLVIRPEEQAEENDNTTEVLVPYIDQVVQKVDLVAGKMIVDWDSSFLEE